MTDTDEQGGMMNESELEELLKLAEGARQPDAASARAENARLRETLKRISDYPEPEGDDMCNAYADIKHLARAALEEGKA